MNLRELAFREGDGVTVQLLWDAEADEVLVRYSDDRQGVEYTIYPPREQALDAFEHPNAYATRERLGIGRRRRSARIEA